MATTADTDREIFDAASLAMVQRLIPPERLQAYLRDLDRQFGMLAHSVSSDPTLQSRAHKIVSQAGMLGLTRMSDCAAQVEDACRAGIGQSAAVLRCSPAIADIRHHALPAVGGLAGSARGSAI